MTLPKGIRAGFPSSKRDLPASGQVSKHALDLDFVLGLEKGAGDTKTNETYFPALERLPEQVGKLTAKNLNWAIGFSIIRDSVPSSGSALQVTYG